MFVMLIMGILEGRSQDVALKTNLLYDATATINLGVEVGLAPRWTFDLSGNLNDWTLSGGKRWKHWMAQPEARYWFCDRFAGHFLGLHVLGGQYNVGGFDGKLHFFGTDFRKLKDSRFQGWYLGAGIAYGYTWILGRHWNMEAELGVGYVYTEYDQFNCTGCGRKVRDNVPHNYVGPTKLALNLIYVF